MVLFLVSLKARGVEPHPHIAIFRLSVLEPVTLSFSDLVSLLISPLIHPHPTIILSAKCCCCENTVWWCSFIGQLLVYTKCKSCPSRGNLPLPLLLFPLGKQLNCYETSTLPHAWESWLLCTFCLVLTFSFMEYFIREYFLN